jgi:hypothetical protein
MSRQIRLTATILILMLLTSCASITSVPAGPLTLGEGHPATLDREWSDISTLTARTPQVRVLTIDGLALNRLYVAQGLKPGEGLTRPMAKDKPVPAYRKDMSPNEVIEFVSDSVAAQGYQRVETGDLKPARLWGKDAVRIELTAKTETGLEVSGVAEAADIGGRLYLILYLAPSEHYFSTYLPSVEALFHSAA